MRTPHLMVMACIVLLVGLASNSFGGWTWTTLDCPAGTQTTPKDICGNNIVGIYRDSTGPRGFLYDGHGWTMLVRSGSEVVTDVVGISGNNIVGMYRPGGISGMPRPFIYDGSVYRDLPLPGFPTGIDGSSIVGTYVVTFDLDPASFVSHGFRYDGSAWTVVSYPNSTATGFKGISGDNIIGSYVAGYRSGYFLNNGTTWTLLQPPVPWLIFPNGIDGSNIVGRYSTGASDHGFLYNGANWISLDYPGALSTVATGISGNNIVGYYLDGSGRHGFLLTVPEPVTLSLLIAGGMLVYRRGRENGNRK